MKKPTDAQLRTARADFRELLTRPTPEATWQRFFASNPYVLSRGLPLRLEPCDILPLGRPGRSEPDFLLYPGSKISPPIHGLVELKTNTARITTVTRKNVITLSRDAATAVRQLELYDQHYDEHSPVKRCVSFASASHLFVIMGMSEEIEELSSRPELSLQLRDLLPLNTRLLTFDELLDAYESGLSLRSFVLLPDRQLMADAAEKEQEDAGGEPEHWGLIDVSARVFRAVPAPHAVVNLTDLTTADEMEAIEALVKQMNLHQPPRDGHPLIWQPFAHPSPFGSRFSPSGGVLYLAEDVATSLAECNHYGVEFARTANAAQERSFDIHEFQLNLTLHDLRALPRATSGYLRPNSHAESMALGSHLQKLGSNGLLYPSVRGRGWMAALFKPDGVVYAGLKTRARVRYSREGGASVDLTAPDRD